MATWRSCLPPAWRLLPLLPCFILACCLGSAASAAPKPLVYAALGASETVGVGADNPATQSWVADLARKLPRGSRLVNLGKSGAQLSYGVQHELPLALAARPDLVTVWLAVNDINGRVPPALYRQELDTLLGTLRRRTHAMVFVGNVPDLTLMPLYSSLDHGALRAIVATYNGIIRDVAAAHHAIVVDIYTRTRHTLPAHPEYLSGDGFHPSTAGYADIAVLWWSTIRMHYGVAL